MKLSAGITATAQDISLPIFRSLKSKGYNSTRWHTNAGATDVPCLSKDGDVQDLNSFLFGLQHAAPIYEKTHVGCKCTIEVTAPGKPTVMVNAFGIVQGDIDVTPTDELPAEDAEAVAQDLEVAETNTKTPKKTSQQWKKVMAPKPVPKGTPKGTTKVPEAKTPEKRSTAPSKAVPVNAPNKAGAATLNKLVKKVLDVK